MLIKTSGKNLYFFFNFKEEMVIWMEELFKVHMLWVIPTGKH